MRASPFSASPALYALIAIILSSGTTASDQGEDCIVTISEETEFKWSKEHQAFLTLHPGTDGGSLVSWKPEGNESSLCIHAPEKHRVVLRISLTSVDENVSATERIDFCDPSISPDCKATCLSAQETDPQGDKYFDYETSNSSLFEVLRDVSFEFFTLKYSNRSYFKSPSEGGGQIERLQRFSIPPLNSSPSNTSSPTRHFGKRRTKRRRRHRCRKCSWKGHHRSNRKRSKRKKNAWKAFAEELLLEFHKRWLEDQQNAAKRKEHGEVVGKALSSESKEARARIQQFIIDSGRRRKLEPTRSLQRPSSIISQTLRGRPQEFIKASFYSTSLPAPSNARHPGERSKRVAIKSTATSSNESPKLRLSNFTFCGLGPLLNDFSTSEEILNDHIQRKFPLILQSRGPEMRIRMSRLLPADDPLLSMLQIKISFSLEDNRASDVEVETTISVSNGNALPTRTQDMVSSAMNGNETSTLKRASTLVHVDSDDSVHVIIGVTFGSFLVFVLAGLGVACLYRRKRCALFRATKRQLDLVNEGEAEKCLASVDTFESRPDYISNRTPEGSSHSTEVNERRMLEHKKQRHPHRKPGKAKRKEDVTDSRKDHETKQQQQSRQHVTQCKHLLTMRGSSRHEHCIVCQIAGKPHRPITNTQYASEFLPPASRRNNNSGYSSQDNFDKFNRLQNNPYRNSPSITPRSATSQLRTVQLPDGEERYRNRQDFRPHGDAYRDPIPVCVKAPPNRTIFACDPLPFTASTQQQQPGKIDGYPGPPTSVPKNNNFERSVIGRESRSRNDAPNGDCICRYIINHIDEPPPEYSDVVKEDPHLREVKVPSSNTGPTTVVSREKDVLDSLPDT